MLPVQLLPVQLLPVQLLPVQLLPVQLLPVQLLPASAACFQRWVFHPTVACTDVDQVAGDHDPVV